MKIDINIDELLDVVTALEDAVNEASASAIQRVYFHTKQKAQSKSGGGLWASNFKINHNDDGSARLWLSGLGNVAEEGQPAGWLSDALERGTRFQHNKAEGKNYVDVPFSAPEEKKAIVADATEASQQFRPRQITMVERLKNTKEKRVQENITRLTRRHVFNKNSEDDVVESTNTDKGDHRLMQIRRWTPNAIWPKTARPGLNLFDEIESDFAKFFFEELKGLL